MRDQGDGGIRIRVDGAQGFTALVHDPLLSKLGISLEIGNPKNVKRNPVAERAIRELGTELLNYTRRRIHISGNIGTCNSQIKFTDTRVWLGSTRNVDSEGPDHW